MTIKETPPPLDEVSKIIVSFLEGHLLITDENSKKNIRVVSQQDIEELCQDNGSEITHPETDQNEN